jgi:hypothetical protein
LVVAAPDFVPIKPTDRVRVYQSPPRRADAWNADRPGDLPRGQPKGAQLGSMGPDQGYAYSLVHQFDEWLRLGEVDRDDAVAGCVAVALKRASLFGRAPVIHDLSAAFSIFGFLDEAPPAELLELRQRLFAEVHSSHHYVEQRHLVDLVPEEVLRHSHDEIAKRYESDWTANLADLPTVS